ncbi:MAG: polysulfide reductase NrfD [Candidatus Eisenbacteria bacterium]|nr:polysulfide reductase NrfD [Candidatus Eisenbacteria bacterium]
MAVSTLTPGTALREAGGFLRFFLRELKPKGKLLTPFNLLSAPIMLLGVVLLVIRFARGLGAITNLSQDYPWGLWVGFDVITGVAFAGGAYVVTFMVYVLRQEKYHPIVRITVLNGLLAYVFYAGALLLDLGRPWKVVNPIIGNSFGVSSVMFLVAWHFLLYMLAEFIEFSPTVAEWVGRRRAARVLGSLTLGATIFGITLSTLHQSGLGALFLMAKSKIHPLWYSEFIPILFLVSSVFAGLSMVILEGTISRKVFGARMSPVHHTSHRGIVLGLSRVCAGTLFVYLFLKALVFIHGQQVPLLATPLGLWFLVEVAGFVLVPCVLFALAVRRESLALCRVAAAMTLVGIVLNRLNVSIVAFRWYDPVRYVPSWGEVVVTLTVIFAEIWVLRWVVERMPVLSEAPGWVSVVRAPVPATGHAELLKEA